MKVNDVVFQDYQGIRRYGVIKRVEIREDGWSYAGINWLKDDKYEAAMKQLEQLRNVDYTKTAYRTDEVKVIDAEREISMLQACLKNRRI